MLHKKEHEYFHRLMFNLVMDIEPKFTKGAEEHRHEGMLWDMTDEELEENINNEIRDLIVYWSEKQRREHERTNKQTS